VDAVSNFDQMLIATHRLSKAPNGHSCLEPLASSLIWFCLTHTVQAQFCNTVYVTARLAKLAQLPTCHVMVCSQVAACKQDGSISGRMGYTAGFFQLICIYLYITTILKKVLEMM
jgi:hypothetical protein